ncbi:MAG: aldehyde dehydrogenase family protein [Myxococcales bacterium]|nr:aldehyde dehydrogenase family protein [Myxococcales bacterium]
MIEPITDPFALAAELSGKHLIDGAFSPNHAGATFEVFNPATGKVIGHAAAGDAQDVDRAVRAAKAAQVAWGRMKARDRGKIVAACGARLAAHVEELGRLTALETGKALRTESRVEASVLADTFVYFGGLASELKGETIPFNPDMLTMTVREPVGVVAAILPWNAPLLLMALKIAPALVAGNSVVVKSAEEAPFGVLRVAQLLQEVLPKGVFNLISGMGPECGGPLTAHPDVAKISFTGSVETGRIIYRAAAEKLAPVTLELGGKSPMIVMEDADLDRAVDGAIGGMRFTRQGQSCTAASRMLVQRGIHDAFVERLKAKVNAMVMGDPLDEATDIGTIVSPGQFATVQRYLEIGRAAPGATAHTCSALPSDPALKDGLFVQPVIFTGLSNDHQLCQEEIFGPVTCVIAFDTYEEAIELANACDYALAGTIWTRDLRTAMDAVHRIHAGFVQVNQNLVVQPMLPYGGFGQSGLGKEASLGAMLDHFTHSKTILINMT